MGFRFEHPPESKAGEPQLQGQYQDSTYYLIPTMTLPLLLPLTVAPWIGSLVASVLDPPLRVLVESGYDRTVNPGLPTSAKFLYSPNPVEVATNFIKAIPTGWDNGIAYITKDPGNRPFHTTPQGPYGVGGPPVNTGAIDAYGPPTPAVTAAETVAMKRTPPARPTIRRKPAAVGANSTAAQPGSSAAKPRPAASEGKQRRADRIAAAAA